MPKVPNTKFWLQVQITALLAALLYCSWPLGYILNPSASKASLASGLEAAGQPYNWLFIGADILSGLLVLAVCWLLWRHYRSERPRLLLGTVLLTVAGFVAGTILDAALPERCVPNLQVCPSFTHDHLLLIHGLFSILASVGLFISLLFLWFQQRRNYILNILLAGYIIFGLVSLIEAVTPGKDGNWSQHYYITLCSIWLAVFPYALRQSLISRLSPIVRAKYRKNLPLVARLAENLWGV